MKRRFSLQYISNYFTKKAAKEMKERVEQLVGEEDK